jgi:PadR family transcriptional regulator, regulatory protein PadR
MADGSLRVTEPLLDVLEALLAARDYELHGWAITSTIKRASPTVYSILERLTDHGIVTARWEDQQLETATPRRRLYRLTGHGATVARSLLTDRRPYRPPAGPPRPATGWAIS